MNDSLPYARRIVVLLAVAFALCLACLGSLVQAQALPQGWQRVTSLPPADYTAAGSNGETLYAATADQQVFFSLDDGRSWQSSALPAGNYYPTAITSFGGRFYVGVSFGGIFSTADTGRTWSRAGRNLLTPLSFVVYEGHLYAGCQGSGVARLNTVSQTWAAVGRMPTYSNNVDRLALTPAGLMAAAGANGTYYLLEPGTQAWTEGYYSGGGLSPGLIMTDLSSYGGTVWAAGGGGVRTSADSGRTWSLDRVGLRMGAAERFLYQDETDIYVLSNSLAGGTWIHHRPLAAPAGSSWSAADGGVFLPARYSYSAFSHKGVMYINQDSGLIYRAQAPTATAPTASTDVRLYPNPSPDGSFTLQATRRVDEITLYNALGQAIGTARPRGDTVSLPGIAPGVYTAHLRTGKQTVLQRVQVGL